MGWKSNAIQPKNWYKNTVELGCFLRISLGQQVFQGRQDLFMMFNLFSIMLICKQNVDQRILPELAARFYSSRS